MLYEWVYTVVILMLINRLCSDSMEDRLHHLIMTIEILSHLGWIMLTLRFQLSNLIFNRPIVASDDIGNDRLNRWYRGTSIAHRAGRLLQAISGSVTSSVKRIHFYIPQWDYSTILIRVQGNRYRLVTYPNLSLNEWINEVKECVVGYSLSTCRPFQVPL